MNTILGREPVLILGLVRAIIVLVVAFGLQLTAEQIAAVYIVAEMVLSVIARQRVTPEATPRVPAGSTVTALAKDQTGVKFSYDVTV